ncbi:Erv29 [Kluyveromyces lactis]|nr:Erv29 [Kluyveromyces lactis]
MSFRGNNLDAFPTAKPGFQGASYGPASQSHNVSAKDKYRRLFEQFAKRVEDLTEHPLVLKIRPYTPIIARFFIVATFYEDSLRIIAQWSDQVFYLWNYRHFPYYFVVFFLFCVVISMFTGATLLILRKQTVYATSALICTVILQGLVYGLFTGSSFVLRNISVIGGLLIAFGDSIVTNRMTFGMLPELDSKDGKFKNYLLLAGRILMVLLFITFTFTKSWLTVLLTIAGTVCIAIGYKTKFASISLGLILAFYNITVNNYWFYGSSKRDFLKYEFYQNLSIIGGLLLIGNTGAGQLSIDEKKKIY